MNALTSSFSVQGHIPVMLSEVLDYLKPQANKVYIDGTFGGGGYSKAILSTADCSVWGIDRDPDAIKRGELLSNSFPKLHLVETEFAKMDHALKAYDIHSCDGVVLDLGVSSYQLDQAERGFSFRYDGPLDMRMSQSGPTAADLVNNLTEKEIADILWVYGEERFSRRIAKMIVKQRIEEPFKTTQQLANLIRNVIPADKSGIDPATRSFQALRIKVNDELQQIQQGVQAALQLLKPEGRLVVVSFHSLEDRIIKDIMKQAAGKIAQPSRYDPQALITRKNPVTYRLLTSKPVRPTEEECRINPRSRSARLRAIERLPFSEQKGLSS